MDKKVQKLNKQGISLLLAGGGARGLIQLGMLKAFKELGFEYNHLYAVSVGAINGAMLQQNQLDLLESLWTEISNNKVYSFNPFTVLQAFTTKASIYDSSPLFKLMKKYINPGMLKKNSKLFVISTTNANTSDNYCLSIDELKEDEITTFIRGSSSPPGLFPLVEFRGNQLCDGGVSNNFLISEAIKDENDILIVMTPTKVGPVKINNILDVLKLLTGVSERNALKKSMGFVEEINRIIEQVGQLDKFRTIKLVLIEPDTPSTIDLLDFDYKGMDKKFLIKYGYELAKSTLIREFNLEDN